MSSTAEYAFFRQTEYVLSFFTDDIAMKIMNIFSWNVGNIAEANFFNVLRSENDAYTGLREERQGTGVRKLVSCPLCPCIRLFHSQEMRYQQAHSSTFVKFFFYIS